MSDPRDWQAVEPGDPETPCQLIQGASHAFGFTWAYTIFESFEDMEQRAEVTRTEDATGKVIAVDRLQGRVAKETAFAMIRGDMDAADPNRPSLEDRFAAYVEEERLGA